MTQEWQAKPEGVVGTSICSLSGLLPGDSGCATRFEYFLDNTVPTETESLKKPILINKTNSQPVQPGQNIPPENVETQEHQVLIDVTSSLFCLDCQPMASEPAVFNANDLKRSN